jgi:hypothetical protein
MTEQEHRNMEAPQQSSMKHIFRRIVLFLGSLHLSIMSSLGIWLWSNPGSFGKSKSCAIESASIVIVGKHVPLGSKALHTWSLLIYSLFAAPGVNLVVPMSIFLGMYIGYQAWHRSHPHDSNMLQSECSPSAMPDPSDEPNPPSQSLFSLRFILHLIKSAVFRLHRVFQAWYNHSHSDLSIFPVVSSMIILFAINVIFVVDIELTLRQNHNLQDSNESNWTFGQTLAMFLLVMPFA